MLPAIRNNGSALVPAPIARLTGMFDHFDRFFENAFAPLATLPNWSTLPLSMWEDGDTYHVEIDAPGVTEKDIEVTVRDGELIVRGERKSEEKGNGYDTRTYGRFEQRVSLPTAVDAEKVEAKLTNGVLTVSCPKSETAKPRKIAITSGGPKAE